MQARRIAIAAMLMAARGATQPATAQTEPCLLTVAEVGAVMKAQATMDRPQRILRNKVSVGGDCTYRSARDRAWPRRSGSPRSPPRSCRQSESACRHHT